MTARWPSDGGRGLQRRLGTADAVVVGLGAMVGAGVFTALAPAAAAAGELLLVSLAVAAVVATCNALSTAALAARHPESGGAYVYGRERLGPFWGWLAGAGFVVGKTASCAAMALAFGAYATPGAPRLGALAALGVMTAVVLRGIGRTLAATRVLLVLVLLSLALVVVSALVADGGGESGRDAGPYGVLQGAGLLFFAFAGYARIATLGEEVRDPERTIPRAVPVALGLTLLLYAVVALAALHVLGAGGLAASSAPLADVVPERAAPLVRAGAGVASLGVLLSLLAGVSRTVLAMARTGDLPRVLAAVSPRHRVPARAQLLVSAAAAALVAGVDLTTAIGASSVAVLAYYAVANAAALRLGPHERRHPRAVAALGLAGCLLLAGSLPVRSVVAGAVLLGGATAVHLLRSRP